MWSDISDFQVPLYTQNYASCITILDNLLDELSHILTECFTARPFTLSMPVKGMGTGMLLVTVPRARNTKRGISDTVKQVLHYQ